MYMDDILLYGTKHSDIQTLRSRFRIVMRYVLYCYSSMIENKISYSKKEWAKLSKDNKFEDYLREKLVDDYLETEQHKDEFVATTQSYHNIHEIYFSKENEETYKDSNGQKGKNKNDIYVLVTNLKRHSRNSMEYDDRERLGKMKNSRKAWFQIECKILDNSSSQHDAYIEDIHKFLDRTYEDTEAMPFGGQIAFIKKGEIMDSVNKINTKLAEKSEIGTIQNLMYFEMALLLPFPFQFSFQSIHQHRLGHKFDIYHLLLDYRNIIVD